jgi:hypothetical protein
MRDLATWVVFRGALGEDHLVTCRVQIQHQQVGALSKNLFFNPPPRGDEINEKQR